MSTPSGFGLPRPPFKIEELVSLADPDGRPLPLRLDGDTVRLDIPSHLIRLKTWRRMPPRSNQKVWLERVQGILRRTGLRLVIQVDERPVAELRGQSRGNWPARWVGLQPLELRLGGILVTGLRLARPSHRSKPGRPGA